MDTIIKKVNDEIQTISKSLEQGVDTDLTPFIQKLPSSQNSISSFSLSNLPPTSKAFAVITFLSGLSTIFTAIASGFKPILALPLAGTAISGVVTYVTAKKSYANKPTLAIEGRKRLFIEQFNLTTQELNRRWKQFIQSEQKMVSYYIDGLSVNEEKKQALYNQIYLYENIELSTNEFVAKVIDSPATDESLNQLIIEGKALLKSGITEATQKQEARYSSLIQILTTPKES